MDPVTIIPLALSAWKFIAPYAKTAAGKLMEKSAEAFPDVVGKLWNTVKAKMESKPETASLPAELASTPDDQAVQGAFQYQLRKLLENDEAFAKELQELVEAAKKQSASYSAKLEGDGAIAQGKNARAVGAGGMMIEGGVSGGSVVIQGDHNEVNDGKRRKKD